MFGLTKKESEIFKKLNSPVKIQDFLDTFPRNWEKNGATCMSPRRVLRERKMHCIEGALLAAAAFWFHGQPPLVMDFRAHPSDDDHVIAVYKRNGYFGAISKSNHVGLRFRDPVYRTVRELAMSYFHEYIQADHRHKTLRGFSGAVDLRRFGAGWITAEEDLIDLAYAIDSVRHFSAAPKKNLRRLRLTDKMERRADRLMEWPKSHPLT